jgi:hypothetical protein
MTRAEGIAKLLAEHKPAALQVSMGEKCRCGYWTGNEVAGKTRPVGFIGLDWHRAQVVDAWLAGQEHEEWGLEWAGASDGYLYPFTKAECEDIAPKGAHFRRRVTEWEEA